jgi:hypothetical protein
MLSTLLIAAALIVPACGPKSPPRSQADTSTPEPSPATKSADAATNTGDAASKQSAAAAEPAKAPSTAPDAPPAVPKPSDPGTPANPPAAPADPTPKAAGSTTKFDVNDVAFMFPAPKTAADVNALISGDDKLADGSTVWPREFFDQVIETATTGAATKIGSSQIGLDPELKDLHNWKVAGIRVNPASLGGSPEMLHGIQKMIDASGGKFPIKKPVIFGIRLVMQPVLVNNGNADVKDMAAHVVFNLPDIGIDDDLTKIEAVKAIVAELVEIKGMVKTDGEKLGVHPGLAQNVPGFNQRLHDFLKRQLKQERFAVVSFMGLDAGNPEPWIFFRVKRNTSDHMDITAIGGFATPPAAPPTTSEMLVFRGKVQPTPTQGVSTSVLFEPGFQPGDDAFPGATPVKLKKQDVADFVANPKFASTLNTDCVSCHTETTRRLTLDLKSAPGIAFPQPAGISEVDGAKVFPPKTPQTSPASWNVRVFGWGPTGSFGGRPFEPTIVQRAANEAAESADFFNTHFFSKL